MHILTAAQTEQDSNQAACYESRAIKAYFAMKKPRERRKEQRITTLCPIFQAEVSAAAASLLSSELGASAAAATLLSSELGASAATAAWIDSGSIRFSSSAACASPPLGRPSLSSSAVSSCSVATEACTVACGDPIVSPAAAALAGSPATTFSASWSTSSSPSLPSASRLSRSLRDLRRLTSAWSTSAAAATGTSAAFAFSSAAASGAAASSATRGASPLTLRSPGFVAHAPMAKRDVATLATLEPVNLPL
uniref:Uncharacterized protein n=1 Tax=Zea mays TaxID=4577 RepID=C0PPJ2_MAIZE|nr:unknown [Zea mays]